MASSATQFSLFLLLTLLSSLHTHARDSQFFNKVPSTTNTAVVPNNNNDNAYGLYGLDPPSTTTTAAATTNRYNTEFKQPLNKYLPKNYNPVAYVTQPEGTNTFTEERTNYYNGEQKYYNNQQEKEKDFRSYPTAATNNRENSNYYYNGDGTAFSNGYQPRGMSDTRFLEHGKYFYDINAEKYSSNHPYESLRGVRERSENNNRNFYGNAENNGFEFNGENSIGGYQNQEEFQEEENLP